MNTRYLFIDSLDETAILSVCLDEQGHAYAPLMKRTIEELHALDASLKTVVVLPTIKASLHQVELPILSERKARAAIPYALEEALAQPVNGLHFVYDRHFYVEGQYLIAALDKSYLDKLINHLRDNLISFDVITLDWFALNLNEACLSPQSLIVNDALFKGAVVTELASTYLQDRTHDLTLFQFTDSLIIRAPSWRTFVEGDFALWCAKRLQQKTCVIDICQGEYKQHLHKQSTNFWVKLCLTMAFVWLVCFIFQHAWILHVLHKKNTDLDQAIASIYRQFFPEARQVISPKFRISQYIQAGSKQEQSSLWVLLDKLAPSVGTIALEQLRFQNNTLIITLHSKDFAQLEQFQQRLRQTGIQVSQTQASSDEQHVLATLELRL